MERKYKRLTYNERIIIQTLLKENKSKNYIAIQLNRNRSTISNEVNLWIVKPTDSYNAELAHWYALETNKSKRAEDKINSHPKLKMFIYRSLLKGTSPELMAGQIKLLYPNDPIMSISYESIYKHIYRHRQTSLGRKLIKLLPYHHHKRRDKRKFGKKRNRIKDQVSIDLRPEYIKLRLEAGHLEGDLMIGVGQKSAIGTIVDRKTRFLIIVKIKNRKSKTVTQEFAKHLKKQPKYLRKTMTYDNGPEMAYHKWLSKNTGMDIYFAHPYSSWERGTNENTNGLIRRFLPKGTDFNKVSMERLKQIENNLNNRPRKVLGFKTPMQNTFSIPSDSETIYIDDQFVAWNSGTIGFTNAIAHTLVSVEELIDELYAKSNLFVVEQIALSYYFQKLKVPKATNEYLHHYWDFKEFRPVLTDFFNHNKTKSLTELIAEIDKIHPLKLAVEKRKYKKLSFLQKQWRKITTGKKWQMPTYTLD